jgi:glycosyltransferase involved in cell wall biosynthesis
LKKIKILQTPIRFYPYVGGVELVSLYLSLQLIKLGYDIKVICANEPNSKLNEFKGIKIKRLPYFFKITNTNISFSLIYHLFKEDYDLVQTYIPTPWTSDLSVLIAKIRRKRSVIFIQNDLDKPGFIPKLITELYLNTIFRLTLKLTDKILVVNENWNDAFNNTKSILESYKYKIIGVPNGVDTSIFKNLNIKRNEYLILFVSILDNHHKFKGLDFLLKAMIPLIHKNSKIKLMIVGEGELKKYYQKVANEIGINSHVLFVGAKSQSELVQLYNKAGVFVLPSIEIEGFGIVAIEAMACGLPIIVSDIVGVSKEVKNEKTGIVVKPKDIKALSRSIEQITENRKVFNLYSKNGTKLVNEKYDWRLIAKSIQNIYKGIL